MFKKYKRHFIHLSTLKGLIFKKKKKTMFEKSLNIQFNNEIMLRPIHAPL